jgi:hypothetical protein
LGSGRVPSLVLGFFLNLAVFFLKPVLFPSAGDDSYLLFFRSGFFYGHTRPSVGSRGGGLKDSGGRGRLGGLGACFQAIAADGG